MYISNALTLSLLPLLTLAAEPAAQKPLQEKAQGWLNKAKSYLPTAVPTVPGLTAIEKVSNPKPTLRSPIKEAANLIAAKKVVPLSRSNYKQELTPAPNSKTPLEWLVFITGGNKTCQGGHCHNLHVSWNESAAILAADPLAPKLGVIDCDNNRVLCAIWTAQPPTIWHIRRPAPGQALQGKEIGESEIHINYVNFTTTGVNDIVALHTGNKYRDGYPYAGTFHLFDGWLAKNGLLDIVGWTLFIVGVVPTWGVMLTISMGTRALIQRRAGQADANVRRRQLAAQGGAPLPMRASTSLNVTMGFIKKRKDQPATQVVELPAKRTRRAAGQSIGITNEKFQATKEPGTRLTRSGSKNVVPDEAEESETPEPKRRIAKRTAVTKTKDKDKIQLVQDNHMNSALLSLPGEIRDKILRELVGDKSVHMKLGTMAANHDYWRPWDRKPSRWSKSQNPATSLFRHHVCGARAAEMCNSGPATSTKPCHRACKKPWDRVNVHSHLDLAVMGSCRQLYEETHHLLWTSSLFIFDDVLTLSSFASALNSGQRQKIHGIQIEAAPPIATNVNCIPKKVIDGLPQLQRAQVHLHQHRQLYGASIDHSQEIEWAEQALAMFRPLQALPLIQASVTIRPHYQTWRNEEVPENQDLNRKLDALAENLVKTLLSPDGAEEETKWREAEKKLPHKWTEAEILATYRATAYAASQVLDNARRQIYRANRSEVNMENKMQAKGMDEATFKMRFRPTWNTNQKWQREKTDAKRRVKRFRAAELHKRELCNKKLAILKGPKTQIEQYPEEWKRDLFGGKNEWDESDDEDMEDAGNGEGEDGAVGDDDIDGKSNSDGDEAESLAEDENEV